MYHLVYYSLLLSDTLLFYLRHKLCQNVHFLLLVFSCIGVVKVYKYIYVYYVYKCKFIYIYIADLVFFSVY